MFNVKIQKEVDMEQILAVSSRAGRVQLLISTFLLHPVCLLKQVSSQCVDYTCPCAVNCQCLVLLLLNIAMQTMDCENKFPLGGQ